MDAFARRVLDALPNTIYTIDLDGSITSVNQAWSRFAESNGAPHLALESDVRGRPIWAMIGDAAAREQVERAIVLLRSGRVDAMSWEFPCDSPTERRTFLLQVAPLREGHTVTGFVLSTIDITPSHRAREALIDMGTALSRTIELDRVYHEVSQLLRRAIPYDGFALALVDEETGEMHAAHSAGYDDHPDELEHRLAPRWLEAMAEGRVVVHTTPVHAIEITAPMQSRTGVLGAMTLQSDSIESPQRLQEAERVLAAIAGQTAVAIERASLVRRVEEKGRLEAIGEVAAGIAHELRNPLFGISSAAQLLRFRAREDPVVDRNVGRILREVERLNGMVTDLLEYGRPRPLALAPGNPDEIWDEVLESNRGLLEMRSLALRRVRAEWHGLPNWEIDAERIAQVFINVLVNAVHAAPAESELTLTSSILPTGGWRCTLHNGGTAIPPDALARVFELFFSAKQGGTGIGLALCHRIVDEHGGSIAIESTPEAGTTVTITIPSEEMAERQQATAGR
ncbi:MAG: ATP-binding protein [Gemmatimonadaceae bacterium]